MNENMDNSLVAKNHALKQSSYRFVVVGSVTAALSAVGIIRNLYVPFVSFISEVYDVSQVLVVVSIMLFDVLYAPFSIFIADQVIIKLGTKFALTSGCLLMGLCMIMRCGINIWFPYAVIASIMGALGKPLASNILPRISFDWFSTEGRVGATTFIMTVSELAGGIGNFLPLIFIDDEENNKEKGKMMILKASIFEAFIFSILFVICIVIFVEKPKTPPSKAAARVNKEDPWKQFLELIGNRNAVLLIIISCLQYISVVGLQVNISLVLKSFGMESATAAALLMAAYVILGIVGASIQAVLLGYDPKYKLALIVCTIGTFVSYLLVFAAVVMHSLLGLTIAASALGFFNVPLFILILEFCCEVAYPVDAAIVNGLLNSSGEIMGAIFSLIAAIFLNEELSTGVAFAVLTTVFIAFCIPISFYLEEDLKRMRYRSDADQFEINN